MQVHVLQNFHHFNNTNEISSSSRWISLQLHPNRKQLLQEVIVLIDRKAGEHCHHTFFNVQRQHTCPTNNGLLSFLFVFGYEVSGGRRWCACACVSFKACGVYTFAFLWLGLAFLRPPFLAGVFLPFFPFLAGPFLACGCAMRAL